MGTEALKGGSTCTPPHSSPGARGWRSTRLEGVEAQKCNQKTQSPLHLPKQSWVCRARTEHPGQAHVRSREPGSTYLLLIFEHVVSPLMSPLLRPTEALLQLGRLFLLGFLHLPL